MDILDFFWTFYLNHLSPLWGYFCKPYIGAQSDFTQATILSKKSQSSTAKLNWTAGN